jgi:predicted dehydrogenase
MVRKSKLKFCVIGCGNISLKYFIDALKISNKSDIVVCVDHTDKKRQLVKERFGLPLETDFNYTLNNYDFDAVYLATPTGLHKEYAITAAQKGKHILCEKSLASNFSDAEEMINSAKKNAVAIFEGFMYQFHNQNVHIRKLISEGYIGDIDLINAWFGFPKRDNNDFRMKKEKGGGGLLDAAAYPLHLARSIFNSEPTNINANIKIENGIDISGIINLTFYNNR